MNTETFEKTFDKILELLEDSKLTNWESIGLLEYVKNHILKGT